MKKKVPAYNGTLRDHTIMCPYCISECSGIRIFGKRIKSIAFSTDVAIIKNINADAIIAVYPFTPQAAISQSIISISDVPVFVGVGGGLTGGKRSVRLALQAEHQGAYGVVVNAPIADEVITEIKRVVDIPVIATIASVHTDVRRKLEAGADILNVSGAAATASMVAEIRKDYPDVAIIATGGPTNESILETIEAGANAITYTPPSNGELFARTMRKYLIIQKAGPKRKHNFPFGSVFYFYAVKFIIHPVLCKISNSENTVCKSELFVIYFPIFFSVAYFLIP